MFHFTSPSCSVRPRSQCTGRAGEEELWWSPAGSDARCAEVLRREQGWSCRCSPVGQGISPPLEAAVWSLPPGGSRTQLLPVSPRQYDFTPFLPRLTGAKQGFSFRRGSPLLLETLFPQRTASSFKD